MAGKKTQALDGDQLRKALKLRQEHGLTYREVAERLGCNADALRLRLKTFKPE